MTYHAFDAVTPELALVDPELAARARAQLPDPGQWRPARRGPPPRPAQPSRRELDARQLLLQERRQADEAPAADAPERPRRRVTAALLAPAAAAAFVLALMGALLVFDRGLAEGSRPVLLDPTPTDAQPTPPTQPRAPAAPTANELIFTWAPAPRATAYEVRLFRRGRVIYQGLARQTRHTVPVTWAFRSRRYRLVAGRYVWEVRPRLRGGRLGRPHVHAALGVS